MAKKTGTAMVKWEEELARLATIDAKAANEISTGGGNFLSLRSGKLSYKGANIPGDKMNVVVLDHVLENQLYTDDFDPNTPSVPKCFAFGRSKDEMKPHEKSEEPQSEKCDGCEMNEFGSAEKGKGKACKNVVRLALIPEDGLEDIEGAEVAYMKVPVMSIKNWAGYVRQVAETMKRPVWSVVTTISVVPDPKSQFKVVFSLEDKIDDGETLGVLRDRAEGLANEIMFPYQAIAREEKPAKRKLGKRKW